MSAWRSLDYGEANTTRWLKVVKIGGGGVLIDRLVRECFCVAFMDHVIDGLGGVFVCGAGVSGALRAE